MVEGQFIPRNITQDNLRFYYVLGALPDSAVRGLGNLMRRPLPPDAYQQLKTRLLAAHTLTEFQRMDKLLSAQPLGGQKPSDLLHELVQFCPEGESQSKIFRYLFLQRLPAELRIRGCGLYPAGLGGKSGSALGPQRQAAPRRRRHQRHHRGQRPGGDNCGGCGWADLWTRGRLR
jgi:hypothetical protein